MIKLKNIFAALFLIALSTIVNATNTIPLYDIPVIGISEYNSISTPTPTPTPTTITDDPVIIFGCTKKPDKQCNINLFPLTPHDLIVVHCAKTYTEYSITCVDQMILDLFNNNNCLQDLVSKANYDCISAVNLFNYLNDDTWNEYLDCIQECADQGPPSPNCVYNCCDGYTWVTDQYQNIYNAEIRRITNELDAGIYNCISQLAYDICIALEACKLPQ
jgi:hypothetical protein